MRIVEAIGRSGGCVCFEETRRMLGKRDQILGWFEGISVVENRFAIKLERVVPFYVLWDLHLGHESW